MARRRLEKAPASYEDAGAELSLETVLDHYAVNYVHRGSQNIQCPLGHDDRPSCSLNLTRGLWHCHSCGTGGDAWALIMKKEDCDFNDARAFATNNGLAAGPAGGSSNDLRTGGRWGNRAVPAQSGDRGGNGGYVPSWRRRGSGSGS